MRSCTVSPTRQGSSPGVVGAALSVSATRCAAAVRRDESQEGVKPRGFPAPQKAAAIEWTPVALWCPRYRRKCANKRHNPSRIWKVDRPNFLRSTERGKLRYGSRTKARQIRSDKFVDEWTSDVVNLKTAAVRQNPYPKYAEIREAGPAVRDRRGAVWYVGRYANAVDVLRDPDTFSSKFNGFVSKLMREDGAPHARIRRRLMTAFSGARISGLRAPVTALAHDLVKRASNETVFDFLENIAAEMPATVVAWMLGVGTDRVSDFPMWAHSIMLARTARNNRKFHGRLHQLSTRYLRPGARKRRKAFDDIAECETYLREHFVDSRTRDNWVSEMLFSQNGNDPLTTDELIELGVILMVAGIETTTNLIANAVLILATDRALQDHLRSRPEDLAPFIEEVLRFESPVQRLQRFAMRETNIGGVRIAAGASVEVLVGSANRDPAQFDEPDEFRIDRYPNRHIAFGVGPHFCLGGQLAKLEVTAVLSAMLETLPNFTLLNGPIRYTQKLPLRGPQSLKLEFVPNA
jgi:cytochrome P450